jgi:hypothetical protein
VNTCRSCGEPIPWVVNTRSRHSDAEVDDFKTTVRALAEVIHAISSRQGWMYRSIPEWTDLYGGAALADSLPAVRRTFLLLEER